MLRNHRLISTIIYLSMQAKVNFLSLFSRGQCRPLHHHYITIISPLHHHYITITSPFIQHCGCKQILLSPYKLWPWQRLKHVIDYTYCFSNCMWSLTCLRSSGLFPVFLMLWWLRYHLQFFFLPHGEIYLFPYSDAQSLLMSLPYIAPHSFVRSQLAAFGASGQCFS